MQGSASGVMACWYTKAERLPARSQNHPSAGPCTTDPPPMQILPAASPRPQEKGAGCRRAVWGRRGEGRGLSPTPVGLAPLLVTAPSLPKYSSLSLPKYSSSLAPFKCTPLADDSMRKCRTSSLLSSPSSDTEESISTGVSAAAAPLPAPGSPGCPQLVLAQGGDGQAQILLPASPTPQTCPEPFGLVSAPWSWAYFGSTPVANPTFPSEPLYLSGCRMESREPSWPARRSPGTTCCPSQRMCLAPCPSAAGLLSKHQKGLSGAERDPRSLIRVPCSMRPADALRQCQKQTGGPGSFL